jgi:hypothetical protein
MLFVTVAPPSYPRRWILPSLHHLTCRVAVLESAPGRCSQDGSFLDGLDVPDDEVVILGDADAVFQRDLPLLDPGDSFFASPNSRVGETGEEEHVRLSPRCSREGAERVLGVALRDVPMFNCGLLAAKAKSWRWLRAAYDDLGRSCYDDEHSMQLVLCAALRGKITDAGYAWHSHGHFPLTPDHEVQDGKLYYRGELICFAHNVKGVTH